MWYCNWWYRIRKVSEIVIDNGGSGYSVGDKLVFDNTGTEGVNAEGFVSVVNGGIAGDERNRWTYCNGRWNTKRRSLLWK